MDMVLNLAMAALPAAESSAVEKTNADSKISDSGKPESNSATTAADWVAIFNATLMVATTATQAADAQSASDVVLTADMQTGSLPFTPVAGSEQPQREASGIFAALRNPVEQAVSTGKALLDGVLQQAKLNKDIQAFQVTTKAMPDDSAEKAGLDLRNLDEQLGVVKSFGGERAVSKKAEDALIKHRQARNELSQIAERSSETSESGKPAEREMLFIKEKILEMNDAKSDRVQGLEASLAGGYESAFSRFDAEVTTGQTAEVSAPPEDPAWMDSMRQQMDLAKLKNSDVLRVDVTLRDDQKLGLEANIKDGVLLVRFDAQTNMKEMLGTRELENLKSLMLESAPEVKEVRFEQKSGFENSSGGSSAFASSDQNSGRSSQGGEGRETERHPHLVNTKAGVEVLNTPISSVKTAFEAGRTSWRA
ncbi:MAG: hypothetical protein LW629_03195 [Burkholderiales bacterium]|nr:hypothetical protein [Burkholderiales bacterium]